MVLAFNPRQLNRPEFRVEPNTLARRQTRQAHCVVPVLLAVEYGQVAELA
jgi:hypothetical protein